MHAISRQYSANWNTDEDDEDEDWEDDDEDDMQELDEWAAICIQQQVGKNGHTEDVTQYE